MVPRTRLKPSRLRGPASDPRSRRATLCPIRVWQRYIRRCWVALPCTVRGALRQQFSGQRRVREAIAIASRTCAGHPRRVIQVVSRERVDVDGNLQRQSLGLAFLVAMSPCGATGSVLRRRAGVAHLRRRAAQSHTASCYEVAVKASNWRCSGGGLAARIRPTKRKRARELAFSADSFDASGFTTEALVLSCLVAGEGFEPSTFGL
jgi:hypothetical protein